jgi:hypothetical protein
MSNKLDIAGLNQTEQKNLLGILAKDNSELTDADREHLIARQAYLTPEQLAKYEIAGFKEKALEDMTKAELQAKAEKLNLAFDSNETKADLIAKIEAATK